MKYVLENVTEDEKRIIRQFVENGMGERMLPSALSWGGHP